MSMLANSKSGFCDINHNIKFGLCLVKGTILILITCMIMALYAKWPVKQCHS